MMIKIGINLWSFNTLLITTSIKYYLCWLENCKHIRENGITTESWKYQ